MEIPIKDYTKYTDLELEEEIKQLNSEKVTILKYKLDLLKIYLLNKKLLRCTLEKKSKPIKQIMKYTATLIEKINNLINKIEYKSKTEYLEEQTKNDILKNEGIIYMKKSKGNPKKSNREKLEKLNNKSKKRQKIKIDDKSKNKNVFK